MAKASREFLRQRGCGVGTVGSESGNAKLDSAARAAWLYFVVGNTQEEIADKLRISRPTAQRLISLALSNHLVTFRFEHRVAACMELSEKMRSRFGLKYCDIVPTDPHHGDPLSAIATSAATFIEQTLAAQTSTVLAIGTGRMLRAAVERIQPMECPNHTLVALVGNIATDGSASFFDVLGRLADLTKAKHFPIPLPVLADSEDQRNLLTSLRIVQRTHALAHSADVTLVGVGQMDLGAQQFIDGFISRDELEQQIRLGAVGEITGWSFDVQGKVLVQGVNARITSVPLVSGTDRLVVGVAGGEKKVKSIFSAIVGGIINGIITDELTAIQLLDQ